MDHELLSEYFEINNVKQAMLEIMLALSSFCFTPISNDEHGKKTWHEDIDLYDVLNTEDSAGDFIGYLYLDLFSR